MRCFKCGGEIGAGDHNVLTCAPSMKEQLDEAVGIMREMWRCRDADTQEELRELGLAWRKMHDFLIRSSSKLT